MTKNEILLMSVTRFKNQLIKENDVINMRILEKTEEILLELREQ